jgi:uncharacterized protein (TIGR02246 family)
MHQKIRDVQRQLITALLDADTAALDTLVSDGCRIIGPNGFFIPKSEWIDVHNSRDYQQITLETHDEQIQVYGDSALVCGLQRSRCSYRGEIIDGEFRVTHVWVRNRDRWQLVGIQFTSAPRPANATPQTRRVARPAHTPEQLHAVVEEAFNRGDLDACVGVYEDDATLVVPPDGRVARGRDDIRTATAPLFALAPRMTMTVVKKLEGDGLALTHGRWELAGTATDGSLLHLSGRGTMVSRRRPDGTWGIVLDDPMSADDR